MVTADRGVGTTLSGINLIATIIKMRAPGMSLMKMPVFVSIVESVDFAIPKSTSFTCPS